MASLNVSGNSIGQLVAPAQLPDGWKMTQLRNEHCRYKHSDGRYQREPPGGKPEGVIALADAIGANTTLTSLNVSDNDLHAVGGKVIAEALRENQSMAELCLAGNHLGITESHSAADMSGVMAIATAITTMGALTKLTISGDQSYCEPVTVEASMTEADFSSKYLMASGAIMLAAFLPKCQ